MEKRLTIIIPFANEGEEVENTIQSILDHSNGEVEIIVINDASNDLYDYDSKLKAYPIQYIINKERLGVAASRNLGVKLCQTDYFLLLDAHMRFFDSRWATTIIRALERNPKMILCAQTKVLRQINERIIEYETKNTFWGAFINFYSPVDFFEPQWSYAHNLSSTSNMNKNKYIPCILGAGYATSKSYWEYLHGLDGLLSYGGDEVLISLKVWLEGGICKLLPNVVIGHIYRQSSPYQHHIDRRIYNRLYIGYLLCPLIYQKKLQAIEKTKYPLAYQKACTLFYNNFKEIKQNKQTFEEIRTKDFSGFELFNRSHKNPEGESVKKKEQFLIRSILYIVSVVNKSDDNGLISGKLGTTILLYYFARYTKNFSITRLANDFLEEIIKNINGSYSLDIPVGLLGIGWGISFLHQQKFISGNINDILYEIDKKVTEVAPLRVLNLNLEFGLGGIFRYVLSRLYDSRDTSEQIFSRDFLYDLYLKAKIVIDNGSYNNCLEVYIDYILFYEKKKDVDPANIYDILMLPSWNKYSKASHDISLHGLSGMCLEYILMQLNNK